MISVFLGTPSMNALKTYEKVLKRCVEKNLVLNWERCLFLVTQGIVLGHIVSNEGMQVDKVKIDIISNLPPPKNLKDVRSFLGHVGFIDISSRTLVRSHGPCGKY